MFRLIISEKPSVGHTIAKALGVYGSGRSFIQGNDLIITWCVGHLVEAFSPEDYDPSLKKWRMDSIPFFPKIFQYLPIKNTYNQYKTVTDLINRKEVIEIINATDAGREGELIFDLVYQLANTKKPVLRFWTSSLTDSAILEAYSQMRSSEYYIGLRDAARCRQEADWLVGINCTRAQTLAQRKFGSREIYSIGRVQTPTLAMMVSREFEIQNFVPKDFWTIWAEFQAKNGPYKGKLIRKGKDRFDKKNEAIKIVEKISSNAGKVISVTSKIEKKKPEQFYDLTTLQKEANRRFGFTAEYTLKIAQALYENKLISYPRTNSRCITNADAVKIPNWIKAINDGQLKNLQPFISNLRNRWPIKLDKRFINDKEVDDHTALVPTEYPASGLQEEHTHIYELIARRFLAAHWPDRLEAKTNITTKVDDETFKTTGTIIKTLGWSEVDPIQWHNKIETRNNTEKPKKDEISEILPVIAKDENIIVTNIYVKDGKTSPPKRMTEGDLLNAMQSAGKTLGDEAIKGAMKDCGLGTPATRANIIEMLIRRSFVERNRNILRPTNKGIELITSIQVEALKSPQLTGEWEAQMERMRRGECMRDDFMKNIREFVREAVTQIKKISTNSNNDNISNDVQKDPNGGLSEKTFCRSCGQMMRLIPSTTKGKYFHRCTPCGISESIPRS
jgi:DNA topoisomerase-3